MPIDLWKRLRPWRTVRCPFCFETFPAHAMHLRCDSQICKSDFTRMVDDPILTRALNGRRGSTTGAAIRAPWWIDPPKDTRRGMRRFFDWLLMPASLKCPKCQEAADLWLCPACHSPLPDGLGALGAGHLAIFGPQSVGKSTYVSVLIHELDNRVGPENGFVLDPLNDEVRDRYEREYHETTYGGGRFGVGEDYGSDGFRRSHSATPSLEINRGVLKPLVYRLIRRSGKGPSALLSVFDTAGEDWEMNIEFLRGEARYMAEARGLLFLIDPLRIRAIAQDPRIILTEKEKRVLSADYLTDARKLATFFGRLPVKVPLAICLNKLDRWGHLLPKGTRLYDWACGVPDPLEPGLDEAVHEEVRSLLRRCGASGFLEYVATTFPDHRFFACSALGDASTLREDMPQPLPSPLLVERPVLWLLGRQGVL